jgi:hypothetical protein
MAQYAYKEMLDSIPSGKLEEWDGLADMDSNLWSIGSDYILELKDRLERVESLVNGWDFSNPVGLIELIKAELKK